MLRMQIYSMTEVPAEQMKLFGLGLATGSATMSDMDATCLHFASSVLLMF